MLDIKWPHASYDI